MYLAPARLAPHAVGPPHPLGILRRAGMTARIVMVSTIGSTLVRHGRSVLSALKRIGQHVLPHAAEKGDRSSALTVAHSATSGWSPRT